MPFKVPKMPKVPNLKPRFRTSISEKRKSKPTPMDAHDEDVRRIAADVAELHARGEPFRIFHGSTNSTRPAHGQRAVDISALSRVLSIDTESKTAIVEPSVPMDRLIDATLTHDLVPPVVMEFPGITVGGGFAGSAGESSSFKHGGFHSVVTAIEMVLADGQVVTASATERPDLFHGASGALGTLGIVTRLTLRLIPAGKYVRTVYSVYDDPSTTTMGVRMETDNSKNDFVEGIIFSRKLGVVITGSMTDELPSAFAPTTFSHPGDPWFYLHVQQRIKPGPASPVIETSVVDYIPLRDYLFRYDRGGFWTGELAFKYFRFVPFNRATRRILDRLMHTRTLYRAGLGGGSRMTFRYIVHDLSLPYSGVDAFIDYVDKELGIWPLWLCPLPAIEGPTFHPSTNEPGGKEAMPMLNVGVWGLGSSNLEAFIKANRDLEAKVKELGGRKVLYSHTYYTDDEFWGIYGRDWYDALRKKYNAITLPTTYDKVKVDVEKERNRKGVFSKLAVAWPFAGLVGVLSALR
ncbi:FAD binding domain-containing protein [Plectosphaerella plurivora]|uniref:Delta(24)-sterol reductase n=1 Tax=Plectosphaerella plurivora TaxID=936078 RepID=A0A9P9A797_9PEZI|nr:FAD binding domain-containing protein [Plectosphaerella plurivora]